MDWMYKSGDIDREDYILGKRRVDKNFNQRAGSPVPIYKKKDYGSSSSVQNDQVDMARKLLEDPLMLIKQREYQKQKELLQVSKSKHGAKNTGAHIAHSSKTIRHQRSKKLKLKILKKMGGLKHQVNLQKLHAILVHKQAIGEELDISEYRQFCKKRKAKKTILPAEGAEICYSEKHDTEKRPLEGCSASRHDSGKRHSEKYDLEKRCMEKHNEGKYQIEKHNIGRYVEKHNMEKRYPENSSVQYYDKYDTDEEKRHIKKRHMKKYNMECYLDKHDVGIYTEKHKMSSHMDKYKVDHHAEKCKVDHYPDKRNEERYLEKLNVERYAEKYNKERHADKRSIDKERHADKHSMDKEYRMSKHNTHGHHDEEKHGVEKRHVEKYEKASEHHTERYDEEKQSLSSRYLEKHGLERHSKKHNVDEEAMRREMEHKLKKELKRKIKKQLKRKMKKQMTDERKSKHSTTSSEESDEDDLKYPEIQSTRRVVICSKRDSERNPDTSGKHRKEKTKPDLSEKHRREKIKSDRREERSKSSSYSSSSDERSERHKNVHTSHSSKYSRSKKGNQSQTSPKIEHRGDAKSTKKRDVSEEDKEIEKERRRKEMIDSAKQRVQDRLKSVKFFAELEKKNERKEKEKYDENFASKHMAAAISGDSLENRVRSRVHFVQRSSDMSKNFARR